MDKTSSAEHAMRKICFVLLVLIVGITRFETVESFPFYDSFSSTFAVANISQEKNFQTLGFVRRRHRRSISDCDTTIINSTVTRFCASISSAFNGGHSWEIAKVRTLESIKLILNSQKTLWLVWKVPVHGRPVYMFGLNSLDQPGKYHFVKNLPNGKLVLSEPQLENKLPTTDSRYFEILSSNEWRHVATGLFVTDNDKNKVFLERGNDRAGKYRLEKQNEC